ncbi:VIP36-like protein [Echinops telfairi]|uniref:VIP36-like protein n=1 Tax=Echinops telfairi TaxID=9371 RepID=A0ABM0ZQT7_ECHTE|nr:VIP36-like protein [Echinops telfairi]
MRDSAPRRAAPAPALKGVPALKVDRPGAQGQRRARVPAPFAARAPRRRAPSSSSRASPARFEALWSAGHGFPATSTPGIGTSSSSLWNLMGNAMVMTQYVRLTPDVQSKQGALWNRVPCFLRDWELQVHFKIHGQGKKNLHGDGLAIWYTKDRMQPGPVFGNMDKFVGLGVFVDTYPNEEKQQEAQKKRYSPAVQRVFPYVSAMVNNGSLSYDHERDGRPTELGGCTAIVRNLHYDTFLVIRYVKRHLTIMVDIDGKHEWRDCIEVPGVRLPRGYYFGTSSITGDLSDNHDVVSLKLFELTVERTPEEERLHRDVFLPSVDNMKLPDSKPRGTWETVSG